MNISKIIDTIEEHKKRFNELLENKNNLFVLNEWLKKELSFTSNAIEGNTLTRKETSIAIDENITTGNKPIQYYQEALNHAKAFEFVKTFVNEKHSINEGTILAIHKIILDGINTENAGIYRNVRVIISCSPVVLPNPLKVPDLMDDFGSWLVQNQASIFDAFEAHYRLVSIHPFIDGNGRTARLLMNLMLMKNGYSPIIIRQIDRRRYINAIELKQTEANAERYQVFMLKALERSMKTAIALLDDKTDQKKLLTISKFARLYNVPVSTIRCWVKSGKIRPTAYSDAGYMLFDAEMQVEAVK